MSTTASPTARLASRRVVFIWELGDGLGHATRLLRIAEKLRDDGADCVFVVTNLEVGGAYIARHGFDVLQGPIPRIAAIRGPDTDQPVSVGDILGSIGFASVERLRPLVAGWTSLLNLLRPDLVVSDYAPIANLSLFGGPVPLVVIGDGFTLPPVEDARFRPFRDARPAFDEADLLRVVADVQAERGRPAPKRLPALFAGDRHFVITLPELDCWAAARAEPAVGPLEPIDSPVYGTPTVDYFCYLSATYKFTERVLEGLALSGRTGSVYLRDSQPPQRAAWRARGLVMHDGPRDMRVEAARSRVIIHHGGIGTCEQVLALGRPQLLVPRHFEQTSNAGCLMQYRCAVSLRSGGKFSVQHVAQALVAVADKPEVAAQARAMAETLATRPLVALETIPVACRALLEAKRA